MSVFGIGFDPIKAGFRKAVIKDANGNPLNSSDANSAVERPTATAPKALIHDPVLGDIVPQPDDAPIEAPVNDEVMADENDAIRTANAAPKYDPSWPASEVFDIPEKF